MGENKSDILQGTLDLMVLQTLDAMGPLHGYGIARRIEQVSEDVLQLNQGTIMPRCSVCSSAAGFPRAGAPPTTTARPSSTPSPAPAGSSSPPRRRTGSGSPRSSMRMLRLAAALT